MWCPTTSGSAYRPDVDQGLFLPADHDTAGARMIEAAAGAARRPGEHLVAYRPTRVAGATEYRPRRRGRPRAGDVVIAGRGSLVPAAVSALGPGATTSRLTIADDERRRASFVVPGRPPRLVKLARHPGEAGRTAREQANLASVLELVGPAHVPSPLGHGVVGGHEWGVESLERGVPLRRARRWWRLRHGRATLDALGRWLTELAVRSASPVDGGVAVFAHGDLASGENVLVHRRSFVVIDWETATPTGSPLADLLPTLALGVARLDAGASAIEQTERALAACRGEGRDGAWLLGHVREHLGRLGLATEGAGRLATDAWAQLASMRSRRDDLLREAGLQPPRTSEPSLGERVLERWLDDPELGLAWPALA
jgi:hypothetical protein